MAKVNEKEKDKKALIILPILLGAGAVWLFLRRKVADPDKAILFGKVTDAGTLAGIQGINVACDGYTGKTNTGGDYQIINIPPGTYSVTFTDPLGRYQPQGV